MHVAAALLSCLTYHGGAATLVTCGCPCHPHSHLLMPATLHASMCMSPCAHHCVCRVPPLCLLVCAGYGREAVVALLLQLGADPSAAADASGAAALHRAAARNHGGTIRLLLAAGADPWQLTTPSGAARAMAVNSTAVGAASGVCSAGCGGGSGAGRAPSAPASGVGGQTPLMLAAQFGHESAVQLLLGLPYTTGTGTSARGSSSGAGGDGSNRHAAASGCTTSNGKGVAGTGSAGEGSKLHCHLATHDSAGLTALHLAAQWGMAAVAELLLTAGAGAVTCMRIVFALVHACMATNVNLCACGGLSRARLALCPPLASRVCPHAHDPHSHAQLWPSPLPCFPARPVHQTPTSPPPVPAA